ncbi:MAG: SufE family protein [Bacteroidota bacterium]
MTINEIQDEIIEEFEFLGDWEDKYKYIIDLGKDLAPYPEEFRDADHKVKGCVSQVWLHPYEEDGKLHFHGDSDAMIPKGLISMVLRVYSGQPAAEIVGSDLYFIGKIGLDNNLTPTRSNGLHSMVKKICEVAAG